MCQQFVLVLHVHGMDNFKFATAKQAKTCTALNVSAVSAVSCTECHMYVVTGC
jgi:hypothetical protein